MLRESQHERNIINAIVSPPFVLSAVEGLRGRESSKNPSTKLQGERSRRKPFVVRQPALSQAEGNHERRTLGSGSTSLVDRELTFRLFCRGAPSAFQYS